MNAVDGMQPLELCRRHTTPLVICPWAKRQGRRGGGRQVLRDTQPTLRKPPTCAPFTSSCVNPMNYCSACIFLFLQAPCRAPASACASNNCKALQPSHAPPFNTLPHAHCSGLASAAPHLRAKERCRCTAAPSIYSFNVGPRALALLHVFVHINHSLHRFG